MKHFEASAILTLNDFGCLPNVGSSRHFVKATTFTKSAEPERLSLSVILRLESGSGAVKATPIARYAQVLGIHLKKLLDFQFQLDEE